MGDGSLSPLESLPCDFCGRRDDCPEKYGEKKTYHEDKLTLHYYCLLLSSGIYQRGEEDEGIYGFLVEDIRKELTRSKRLTCNFCKKKGASIGCVGIRCKKSYHYPCGLVKECIFQFMGSFASFCPDHRPFQKCIRNKASSACTICLDLVQHRPSYNILNSPCCKTAWFHRECLQYQALSAGLFFFRCTVCNNKDVFQAEMLRLGIHIPEKDASWELEENAYQDLLQRYQHCDEKQCLCKEGREYDDPDSKWEIVRCQCCGSRGTHLACSSMKIWEQSWECAECRSIISRSVKRRRSGSLATSERIEMLDRSLEHASPKCSRLSSGSHRKILLRYSRQWRASADILRDLKLQVDAECISKLVIDRTDVWGSALKAFRHRNFSPTKTIKVSFTGHQQQPEMKEVEGLSREFFHLLTECLQNSPMFGGPSFKNLSYDLQALQQNLYYEAGRMIAVSLVHGGPAPGFFSKTLFHCLVHGPGNVEPSIEDVADEDMLRLIMKIKSISSVAKLRSTMQELYDYLCGVGCLSIVTSLRDKNKVVKDLLIYHVIRRVQKPFESFRHGLNTLGVLERIQTFPEVFWYVLCQRPEKLTAITLGNLFTIRFTEADKGMLVPETRITEFWMDYLEEVEDGDTTVTLEEILMFATGADAVPPIGFNPEPSIVFNSGDVAIGRPYMNSLELPTVSTYEEFKHSMGRAVRGAQSSEQE
ncbi:G2/M phase-specific E3 ubiquitin-protein ligase [Ambystoma mexicanum]|uniref:G2/M phase-specific E3 ubiquitin-protein ligase n=1 Tax=Ambystoma mexicanum TaxID=8296 RepID=UPI0037E8EC4F